MNGLVWMVELYCVGCGKWLFGWPWRPAGFFSFCVAIRFIQCRMEDASAGVWIWVSFFLRSAGFRRRYEPWSVVMAA